MSTRAVYTFKDDFITVHVYKHSDGYPEGALSWIANALHYAWQLPRFEADEFAAAFAAANKDDRRKRKPQYRANCGGQIRFVAREHPWQTACDAEYHYIITMKGRQLNVEIYAVNWFNENPSEHTNKREFNGSLSDAIEKYGASWTEDDPLNQNAA